MNTRSRPSVANARVRKSTTMLLLAASTLTFSSQVSAEEPSPWMVRGGVSHVEPKSSNGQLSVGEITVNPHFDPSLNVGYFITPKIAVDVLLALPFEHDFSVQGQRAGSTSQLPPNLSLQYHFLPNATIQPYVGVGANLTLFMRERLNSGNDLKLDPSVGFSGHVGVDYRVNRNWRVGIDARYMDIDSDASIDGQAVGTVEIDPLVISVNLGYRF